MRLIANPHAGGGRVRRDWAQILATLTEVFPELEAVQTARQGHGTELAAQAVRDGHKTVLSLGGDGTHSEVAAGIAEASEPGEVALGILHGGTGGDFSRNLGRGTLAEQARRLRDQPAHLIDLAEVRWGDGKRRVFLNEVSFGMSATICANVNDSSKRLGAKGTFLTQTVRTLIKFVPQALEIVVDGRTLLPGPVTSVLLCNGQWAGGGMHFAPKARLADGALDLTAIRYAPLHKSLGLVRALYSGRLLEHPLVVWDRGAHFEIRSLGEPVWIEADGEVVGKTPATVTIRTGAIRLMGVPVDRLE